MNTKVNVLPTSEHTHVCVFLTCVWASAGRRYTGSQPPADLYDLSAQTQETGAASVNSVLLTTELM